MVGFFSVNFVFSVVYQKTTSGNGNVPDGNSRMIDELEEMMDLLFWLVISQLRSFSTRKPWTPNNYVYRANYRYLGLSCTVYIQYSSVRALLRIYIAPKKTPSAA